MTDPLYYGEPAFMTRQPGPVWDQFVAVEPDFDRRKLRWQLPELAWWTRGEALAWRRRFLDRYVKARNRKHRHLLLGLLLCQTCGQPLQKQGVDSKTGDRYYACPGYGKNADEPGYCPQGQFLMERNAFRVLRERVVPVLFSDIGQLVAAAEANARAPKAPAPARQRLELLSEREKNLLATVADRGYTRELKELLLQLDADKAKLQAGLDEEEEAQAISAETLARIRALGQDPLAFYDARTLEQQAAILRLLVANVKIRTNARRGAGHRYLEPEWRPLVSLGTDGQRRWS
jgi:hypothetical protein